MLTLRPAAHRGRTNIDWLNSWHTFSFGDYIDFNWKGFRSLRVINDDFVGPAGGFDTHPHRDMEIVTYVLSGALEHRDSLGTGSVIRPGDVQRMTAGTGILHSEFNPSKTEEVHLLQIWLFPEQKGLTPGYEQKNFPLEGRRGRLQLIASRDGRDGSVTIRQDASLYSSLLEPGEAVTYEFQPGRYGWLQVATGDLVVNGQRLETGDGLAIGDEKRLEILAESSAEFLLFDLA